MNFKRKILSILGSAGVAFSSLLMSVALMQRSSSEDYGIFAFMLITQALSIGLSNALLGSPLMIVLSKNEKSSEMINSYMLANFFLGIGVSVIQSIVAFLHTKSLGISLMYGFAGFFWFIRWFARLYYDFKLENNRVVKTDIIFTIVSVLGVLFIFQYEMINLQNLAIVMILSSMLSVIFIGGDFLDRQINCFRNGYLGHFFDGFHKQGKHSLTGVVSTELTANVHVYFIVSMFGPKHFAPIAAAMLLFRPITIIHTSLTQIELPRLRGIYLTAKSNFSNSYLYNFFLYNISFFCLVFISIILFLACFGDKFWLDNKTYDKFLEATYIFSAIVFIRTIKIPFSVSLQAQDRFKELGQITVTSCLVSIPMTFIILILEGPALSLVGVLIGDIVALIIIYIKCQSHPKNGM